MNASGTRKNWSQPKAKNIRDWSRLVGETRDLVLLDGASGDGSSYLFRNPLRILRAHTPEELPQLMERLDQARHEGLHVAGYANYEAGDSAAREVQNREAQNTAPIAWFGIFSERESVDTSMGWPGAGDAFSLREIESASPEEPRRRFFRDLRKIKNHLARGDVYQINYTMETAYDFRGDPVALYALLRRHQPAAHCAFIKTDERYILSVSPELFFRVRMEPSGEGTLETRPIKGTVPREIPWGGARDIALRESLKTDPKTRAENLMITDLLRNDLGKCARPGTVQVPELFALESLPNLHQMYSVIRAGLTPDTAARLFRRVFPALFPCGSITGAPKIAAQRIIAELEERPRNIYTGALGFASPDETVFNVAIRTLEIERSSGDALRARLGTGCGIVWDSKPAAEWRELELKKAFLTPTLDDFRVIETMLLSHGRVKFPRQHARRLARAVRRFHIPLDFRALRSATDQAARENADGHFRLRLAVGRDGRFEIALMNLKHGLNPFGRPRDPEGFRLLVSRERIWSGNPFRRYKTTERALYNTAFAEAGRLGYGDVLFLNEKMEVAETCIGNILIYDRSRGWSTPMRDSGALNGTLISYLEGRYPNRILRRKLSLRDIRAAKFLFVVNSVRGLQRVTAVDAPAS